MSTVNLRPNSLTQGEFQAAKKAGSLEEGEAGRATGNRDPEADQGNQQSLALGRFFQGFLMYLIFKLNRGHSQRGTCSCPTVHQGQRWKSGRLSPGTSSINHNSPQQQAEQREELVQQDINERVQVQRGNILVVLYCGQYNASLLSGQLQPVQNRLARILLYIKCHQG